jgi:2-phosphosulfolactate phosphatase
MPSPFDQSSYQVRFEWGVTGVRRLAPADVVVVVDVIRFTSNVVAAVARGEEVALAGSEAVSLNGAVVVRAAAETEPVPLVLAGSLRNATAVGRAVMAEQHRRGGRVSVAVVAAGERENRSDEAPLRFAVEDQLGAGAVIAALSDLGIDHCSPEAVVAAESFRALRRAARHLLTASGSGRELEGDERHADIVAAARIDDLEVVPVLRDGVFERL